MSFRTVLAEGLVTGFWEYDPDAKHVVVHWLREASRKAEQRVEELAESTSVFLHDEIGHGHSFSLDTDLELRRRIALLRSLPSSVDHSKAGKTKSRSAKRRK
jgi:hypothetical protein